MHWHVSGAPFLFTLFAVGLVQISRWCGRRHNSQVHPLGSKLPWVLGKPIGNASIGSRGVVPDGCSNMDESVASSCEASAPSLGVLEALVLPVDCEVRVPDDVHKLRQEVEDGLLALSLCTQCDELLPLQWNSMRDLLSNILS